MLLISCGDYQLSKPRSLPFQNGKIDLKNYDLHKNAPLVLRGEWELYWEQLLTPQDFVGQQRIPDSMVTFPSYWNGLNINNQKLNGHGYATYRLNLKNVTSNEIYAIKTRNAVTAFKLWVNDELLLENGVVGSDKESMKPYFLPLMKTFVVNKQSIEIVLQISNFHHSKGGMRGDIIFGKAEKVMEVRESRVAFDLFLIGAIFIICVYHFGLYSLQTKDKSTLFFGILCLMVTIRILCTGEIILVNYTDVSWEVLQKLEYGSFVMVLPSFLLFLVALYPQEIVSRKIIMSQVWLSGALLLLILMSSSNTYSHITSFYQLVILVGCIYIFYVLIKAVQHKREGAIIFLIGYVVVFLTVINEILYYRFLTQQGFIAPSGLFIFIFSQAFLLSKRFSKEYNIAEAYGVSLKREVSERTLELQDKNQRLEELNIEKDRIIDIVAHDLKSPFNKIKGFAQLIKMTGDLNSEQNTHLAHINKVVGMGEGLIRDILDMHAFEYEDAQLKPEEINVSKFINDLKKVFDQELIRKNQRLKIEIDNDVKVFSDPELLLRILDNLLSNAIKFSEEGLQVIIKAWEHDGSVSIMVEDEGPGINKEEQKMMFKRFQKLSPQPTAGESSNGLGLSIIKELVNKLEGNIAVNSELGKGTRFTVTFSKG